MNNFRDLCSSSVTLVSEERQAEFFEQAIVLIDASIDFSEEKMSKPEFMDIVTRFRLYCTGLEMADRRLS